jgi:O-antigen/teichoic acid export membrane protein
LSTNVTRGTLLGIAGQGWHLLSAFLLYAFLARKLGPALFGEWRVVLSVLVWFEIMVNSGLVKVTTREIAQRPDERPRIALTAYTGQMAAAAGAFALMLLLAGPVADLLSNPDMATLLRISALDIPMYAGFMIATGVLLGEHRFERQALAWTVYATAKFVAIAGLVAVGFSVPGALIGNALASFVGFAIAFVPWGRVERPALAVRELLAPMMVASVPFLTLALVEGVGQSADLWLVSSIVSSAVLVGWYASATVLADIPTFLFAGLYRVIFPSVAHALAEGDERLADHYTTQGVRLALIVTAMGVAVVAATGRQVLTLVYGPAFVGAFVPLVILMVAAMGRTVRATCTEVLLARGQRSLSLWIMTTTIVAELALLWVLAPRYGLAGAAIAAALAAFAGALWTLFALRSAVGVTPVATLARSAVAATVAGLGLALWSPAPLMLILALPAAGVVYLGALWLMREVGPEDLASVRAALGR